ncbi:MAG: hypothetical protein ACRC33_14090, partial [Gemmataceae bacterium]
GVPASDAGVQKAARYVREHFAKTEASTQTYTLSLAVLFLDKLGEEADRVRLRYLALRLLAGQHADGGWSYALPPLTPDEARKLMHALATNRPPELAGLMKAVEGARGLERITAGGASPGEVSPAKPGSVRATDEEARKAVADLPAKLSRLPAVTDTPPRAAARPGGKGGPGGRWASMVSDNSNTHFATLALWASLRNGVPAERALRHLAERFRHTQRADGGWNYKSPLNGRGSPAMTGVGLLGLAVGHGLNADPERKALDDDQVKRGMQLLGKMAGGPETKNLYFLWTLERVGTLYNVREVGGKDWYRHAADVLLPVQQPNGAWNLGGYHGAERTVDSCLALLILKRANFAEELTKHLEGGLIKAKP